MGGDGRRAVVIQRTREEIAGELLKAYSTREPVEPLTGRYDGLTVDDAYQIQLLQVTRWLAGGARVKGHKVGLTSAAMQRQLGVDQPDYGHLLDGMFWPEREPLPMLRFLQPRVEPETAFVLARPLRGPGVTVAEAISAVGFVLPALELIDSRIADWKIGLADTIADNASSAGFILGEARWTPAELAAAGIDLADIEAVLYSSGSGPDARGAETQWTEAARGNTGAVLGNPTTAVAWLAGKVASFGVKLEAGHVILPGSCTRAFDARPGDTFRAEFAGLGPVTASFA
jgi:2-keto-4-pentenoate hydratase